MSTPPRCTIRMWGPRARQQRRTRQERKRRRQRGPLPSKWLLRTLCSAATPAMPWAHCACCARMKLRSQIRKGGAQASVPSITCTCAT
eukprot:1161820-Pelagomonas_calceolata.AAC.10